MSAPKLNIDRSALEQLLLSRFFFAPSFGIYDGVKGLYDYGPTGTALQQNIINLWRQHFVVEEDMLEVDCSIITPSKVLETSGHVAKFADWMCRDTGNNEVRRADHLVEEVLAARLVSDELARKLAATSIDGQAPAKTAGKKNKKAPAPTKLEDAVANEYRGILAKIDNYDGDGLGELIVKHDIRNPETGNSVSPPVAFNLMFQTSIGPAGTSKGFLRPETAQGQFMNFARLLEFNNQKMPFASAMVGRSFRNEISPRSGLLRVREFTMAEIEHYVDPTNKDHSRFDEVADIKLPLLTGSMQLAEETVPAVMTIGDAVSQCVIDNKTLGYFMGRIYLFLTAIGIKTDLLRFRQHMRNEMAHYACDCWDAEIYTSYGWIECVGCADRSAYDLRVHSASTKKKLCVREHLAEPLVYEKLVCEPNNKLFGPKLKRAAKPVQEYLESLPVEELAEVKAALAKDGKATVTLTGTAVDGDYEITSDMLTIEYQTKIENTREYTPNVIEPSFGIGRILYALIEHSYSVRAEDEQRGVLSFNTQMSPFKCLILPISGNPSFKPFLQNTARSLRNVGVPARIDDAASVSIGRRYSRNDELGTPFAITFDFMTLKDNTVTLRERDSTKQVRGSLEDIVELVKNLVSGSVTWDDALAKFELVDTTSEADAESATE
ncbi:Glycine--tRNA ligase 1, mitochondrial [Coemansia sp. RSA 1935]|nr:Glycine--tRNA ligase 1, mitochondrial [Coemansia sp. RSA 1935]